MSDQPYSGLRLLAIWLLLIPISLLLWSAAALIVLGGGWTLVQAWHVLGDIL